jgi:hypothetical protein
MSNQDLIPLLKQPNKDFWIVDENTFDIVCGWWGKPTKKECQDIERQINKATIENEYYALYLWCDISGFNYWWTKNKEANYCQLTLRLNQEVPDELVPQLLKEIYEYCGFIYILEKDCAKYINWQEGRLYIDYAKAQCEEQGIKFIKSEWV